MRFSFEETMMAFAFDALVCLCYQSLFLACIISFVISSCLQSDETSRCRARRRRRRGVRGVATASSDGAVW